MSGKAQTIPLGFEVGSGEPVAVPLKHLCITGQTQESGKTTTLEALITRSGLRAIAFITKRGEGSFDAGTAILPYFQERADWEFVESVMEATMNEKKKFERSWTIKACRGGPLPQDFEGFYQLLKKRIAVDTPLLAQLTHTVPEIEVTLKRDVLTYDTSTAIGRVAYLISLGKLNAGKAPGEIVAELVDLGMPTGSPNVSEALGRLVDKGFVKKQSSGRYQAIDGMKVNLVQK